MNRFGIGILLAPWYIIYARLTGEIEFLSAIDVFWVGGMIFASVVVPAMIGYEIYGLIGAILTVGVMWVIVIGISGLIAHHEQVKHHRRSRN